MTLFRNGIVPRLLSASVLVVAAALKATQLLVDPALGTLYGSRPIEAFALTYEMMLGSWLLGGIRQRVSRRVAMVTFGAFGCYSLYLASIGTTSCGCFGALRVSPWLTATLDAGLVVLLFVWHPAKYRETPIWGIKAISLATGITAMVSILIIIANDSTTNNSPAVAGHHVLLQPDKWVGQRFELAEFIDIGDALMTNTWRVLLYHHNCEKCQRVLASFEQRLIEPDDLPLAFVAVPPCAHERLKGAVSGCLAETKRWHVETPIEITVSDGQVISVDRDFSHLDED